MKLVRECVISQSSNQAWHKVSGNTKYLAIREVQDQVALPVMMALEQVWRQIREMK